MVIDCDSCAVRGKACTDCVVTVLLGTPRAVELDGEHQRAIDALASAGMVPRLRLVPLDSDEQHRARSGDGRPFERRRRCAS